VRNSIKQLNQSGESIVGNAALAAEVAVVSWYEPVEQQAALWTTLQQLHNLVTKLRQLWIRHQT